MLTNPQTNAFEAVGAVVARDREQRVEAHHVQDQPAARLEREHLGRAEEAVDAEVRRLAEHHGVVGGERSRVAEAAHSGKADAKGLVLAGRRY